MPPSILYLDDDATQLEVFRETFGGSYDVRVAATVAEARRVIAGRAPDIIISDQMMPEVEGTEFLREAAAACPDSFRVLLTGAISVGEVLPQVTSGVVQSFAPKPWSEEEMRGLLERAAASLEVVRRHRQEGRKTPGGWRRGGKPAWLLVLGL